MTTNSKPLLTLLIFLSLFALETNTAFSQQKKPVISKKDLGSKLLVPSPEPTKKFIEDEFQNNVDKLPPNFNGHSLKSIYDILEKREKTKAKGEFETTEQYRQRVEQDNKKPLWGSLNISSTLGFVSKVNEIGSPINNLYDADNQIMTYTLTPERSQNLETKYNSNYLEKNNCFQIESKTVLSKDYVGTNSYGSKIDVRQTVSYISTLVIENWNLNEWEKLEAKIPIEKAIIAKNKSRVLFIGELVKPYFSTGYLSSKPTIQNPRDSAWIYNYLHLNIREIWIFNEETGEVYAKIKQQNKLLEKTNSLASKSEIENLLNQARVFYNNGKEDEAMTNLRRILASEPMSAEAYLLLGKIHLRRSDLEQSITSFKTALFWDSKLIDAHIALGKIYLQRGNCQQAKNYTMSALSIDSANSDAISLQRQVEQCK